MTDEEKRKMMNKKVRDIAWEIQDKRYQRAEKKANRLLKKIGAYARIMNDAAIKRDKIRKEYEEFRTATGSALRGKEND